MKELVLYYTPSPAPHVAKLKGVLVRMGVRIKNIGPEQVNQTVGYLAGLPGFEEQISLALEAEAVPVIPEEVLVMNNFTSSQIDTLLYGLRKAGVPRIALKAVITEANSKWTFYQLYEELKEEHAAMSAPEAEETRLEEPKQEQTKLKETKQEETKPEPVGNVSGDVKL